MQKIHFSVQINAPVKKVWDTMIGKESYSIWTKPFCPAGSRFEGDWSEGSEICFIGVDEKTGKEMGGMYSRIKENRPCKFISIEHIGMLNPDGTVDTQSEEVKKWTPAFENYTFVEKNGVTEVTIDQDMSEEYTPMFEEMWPKALQALKELTEDYENNPGQ